MTRLFIMIAALSLAVWMGLHVEDSPGLMVVTFAGWRVDMPLWLAVILLTLGLLVMHYIAVILGSMMHAAGFLQNFSRHFRKARAKQFTHKGFVAFVEGNYAKAEKWLAKGALGSDNPWLGYLFAAKAAQQQGHSEKRDHYILLAQQNEAKDHTETAIALTQAELAFEQGQYSQSIQALLVLNKKVPNHPQVLRLLQQNYLLAEQWEPLLELLPKLKQQHVLSKEEALSLERRIIREQFKLTTHQSHDQLKTAWQKIPRAMQLDNEIALMYADALQKVHATNEAEEVLRDSLQSHWSEKIIEYYGQLRYPEPQKLLHQAEAWLKKKPHSSGLMLALGLICERQQLWGKAQRYYEASLSLEPKPQTYAYLGSLLEKMDKPELGSQYFKKGLMLNAQARLPVSEV